VNVDTSAVHIGISALSSGVTVGGGISINQNFLIADGANVGGSNASLRHIIR
jgi:hypothetical protein